MSDENKLSVILGNESTRVKLPKNSKGEIVEIELRPLNFNALGEAEEFFKAPMDEWDAKLKSVRNITYLIYLAVKQSKPDITLEDVGSWFTLDSEKEVQDILQTILKKSGLQQKNLQGAIVPNA